MVMQNISNAVNNVYGAVKYVATHNPGETIATLGLVTVLGLTGCRGDVEPTLTPTDTPRPVPTATYTPVPTPGIEQTISDNASKLRKVIDYVRTSGDDERLSDWRDTPYGVIVTLPMQNLPMNGSVGYSVHVWPNDRTTLERHITGKINLDKTDTDYAAPFVLTHYDSDSEVDTASIVIDERYYRLGAFNLSKNTGLEHKGRIQEYNAEALDAIIEFFER